MCFMINLPFSQFGPNFLLSLLRFAATSASNDPRIHWVPARSIWIRWRICIYVKQWRLWCWFCRKFRWCQTLEIPPTPYDICHRITPEGCFKSLCWAKRGSCGGSSKTHPHPYVHSYVRTYNNIRARSIQIALRLLFANRKSVVQTRRYRLVAMFES